MCSMSVLCPLCTQSSFASIDALRVSLIRAANGPLPCPICHEMFLGLDKLTIHLFSHTNILAATTTANEQVKNSSLAVMTRHENMLSRLMNSSASPEVSILLPVQMAPIPNLVPIESAASTHPDARADGEASVDTNVVPSTQTVAWSTVPTCDICEFNFRSQELLELHFRLVHQNSANPDTENQQQPQPQQHQLDNQLPYVGPKKMNDFKCHLCAKTFKMKGSLRVHLKVVHLIGLPASSTSTKLSICDRIRSYKDERTTATVSVTNANTLETNSRQLPFLEKDTKLMQQILAPENNGNELKMMRINSEQLEPKILMVLKNKNNNNRRIGNNDQQRYELDKDNVGSSKGTNENAKIWDCDVCAKAFTTKYFLKKHKRLHTGEMPYTCEICARTFTFQQSYHKHLLYHSDEKPHVCATCGRAFKELSTLHNHERIHSGEKPFKCEVCGKSFRQRVSFLVHTRIHTGVMPYKCELCQKSFRYKVSQRTHKCLPFSSSILATSQPSLIFGASQSNTETIDRISENFIKAFLESTAAVTLNDVQNSPNSVENGVIKSTDMDDLHADSTKNSMDEAMLSKTIDDIVVESCNKMGIGTTEPPMQVSSPTSNGPHEAVLRTAESTNCPSLKFENMRLYSPEMVRQQIDEAVSSEVGDFSHFIIDQNIVI